MHCRPEVEHTAPSAGGDAGQPGSGVASVVQVHVVGLSAARGWNADAAFAAIGASPLDGTRGAVHGQRRRSGARGWSAAVRLCNGRRSIRRKITMVRRIPCHLALRSAPCHAWIRPEDSNEVTRCSRTCGGRRGCVQRSCNEDSPRPRAVHRDSGRVVHRSVVPKPANPAGLDVPSIAATNSGWSPLLGRLALPQMGGSQ